MAINYILLKTAILANAACQEYIVTNDMPKQNASAKDKAIANILNGDSTTNIQHITRPIKRGDFLRVHGPVVGSALFSRIKSLSISYEPLSYIVAEFEGDGLEVKNESQLIEFLNTLSSLPGWAADDTDLVGALFSEKLNITGDDVSIALRNF
jgi:hypothetical protein